MSLLVLLPFDVDPNVVRPGWTPLIITIVLALAMVGLFVSMRRQFRKIDTNRAAGGFGGPNQTVEAEPGTQPDPRDTEDVTPESGRGRPAS